MCELPRVFRQPPEQLAAGNGPSPHSRSGGTSAVPDRAVSSTVPYGEVDVLTKRIARDSCVNVRVFAAGTHLACRLAGMPETRPRRNAGPTANQAALAATSRTGRSVRRLPAGHRRPFPSNIRQGECGSRNIGVSHSTRTERSDLVCRDLLLRGPPLLSLAMTWPWAVSGLWNFRRSRCLVLWPRRHRWPAWLRTRNSARRKPRSREPAPPGQRRLLRSVVTCRP
jgi:hypothetical protein